MASNQTKHYGLNQWAGTDKFIRTEFNEDNSKIDAAIKAARETADRAMENIKELSGNLYNLILQNEYEGKVTGWKRKLLFDGFRDQTCLASLDASLLWSPGYLSLFRNGQSNITTPVEPSRRNSDESTGQWAASGSGRFIGFTYTIQSKVYIASSTSVTYSAYVNGVKVAEGTHDTGNLSAESTTACSISFSRSYPVRGGDKLEVRVKLSSSNYNLRAQDDGRLSGTFRITSVQGTEGKAVTSMLTAPLSGMGSVWVRHMGGKVDLSVRTGGKDYPLAVEGTRTVNNLRGESCTEVAFGLSGAPECERFSLVFSFALGEDKRCEVADWGLAVI